MLILNPNPPKGYKRLREGVMKMHEVRCHHRMGLCGHKIVALVATPEWRACACGARGPWFPRF